MARLQELQYTVSGGTKVISGVSLSPRSTRGYLRTSLRCKQESARYTWIWIVFDLIMCKILSFFFVLSSFLSKQYSNGFSVCVSLIWRIKNATSKKSPVGKFPAHTGGLSLSLSLSLWTNRRNGLNGLFFLSFNSNSIWFILNWGKGKRECMLLLGSHL